MFGQGLNFHFRHFYRDDIGQHHDLQKHPNVHRCQCQQKLNAVRICTRDVDLRYRRRRIDDADTYCRRVSGRHYVLHSDYERRDAAYR